MTAKLRPFVIWTLQRTGGTNLTTRLVKRFGLKCLEHEPFNPGRSFGQVTTHWNEQTDVIALQHSMRAIAAEQSVIKHCVEVVPWEVTRALAEATVQAEYKHLFLYRKSSRDRLLSLHFATVTGIWGPSMTPGAIQKDALAQPLPIERLRQHEEKCVKRLDQTWHWLMRMGAHPLALSYEDIYCAPPEQAARKLQSQLRMLGLSRSPEDDHALLLEVLGTGDQGTRDKYRAIPGVDKLEEALRGLTGFQPEARSEVFSVERADMPVSQ